MNKRPDLKEMMGVILFLAFFSLVHLTLPYSPQDLEHFYNMCPPFDCGKLGKISLPFTTLSSPEVCGPFVVEDCHKERQKIRLDREHGRWYEIQNISQSNTMFIYDAEFQNQLNSRQCQSLNNLTLPSLSYAAFRIQHNITLFKCHPAANFSSQSHLLVEYKRCTDFTIYSYKDGILPGYLPNCSTLQLPFSQNPKKSDQIFDRLTAKFTLELYRWWPECYWCHLKQGYCQQQSNNKYQCVDKNGNEIQLEEKTKPRRHRGLTRKLLLALGLSLTAVLLILGVFFVRRYNRKYNASVNNRSTLPSKSDVEGDNIYVEVPILSYTELEEATGNFDPKMELGNGGFGTVYLGKLRDGREVAVKRLYEHDPRRVKLFMNEIEILARLRHKNLVSLYGCTSVHSRGLLLVYEYIPNGTVSDHLYGDRAKHGSLIWPVRMRIAIETASALAYLHASDIIHRDVKTDNILLDSNYIVKVADFGLSRLFPTDATHISTAPQGTPGYVDPEYYQCYQLTDKSDVYSFGVVLVELISSMPAIDVRRQRHEINLANLATIKIQKGALDELIDPCLGYQTDEETNRTITLVAELAFRCLQQDNEMRPFMDEVLEELLRAASEKHDEFHNPEERHENNKYSKSAQLQAAQADCDENVLLKNIQVPVSPNSVTYKWISSSSSSSY